MVQPPLTPTLEQPLKILALSGSLRADSHNTALLRTAAASMPEGSSLELYDYSDVPLYNADLPRPESVDRLSAAIAGADGVLIASPEYNHSVTGVLKNMIDWASRPAANLNNAVPFKGVPTAVVSASPGAIGGARGQQHLKVILLAMQVPVYPGPEVVVGQAHTKIVDGKLSDERTQTFLASFVAGFVAWVARYPR